MSKLATGVVVPDSSQPWDLISDLTKMGLTANRVRSANSAAEAQQLVDDLATTAHPASVAEPLVVYRADLNQLYIHNGAGWKAITGAGTSGDFKRIGSNSVVSTASFPAGTSLEKRFGSFRAYPSQYIYGNTYFDQIIFNIPFPVQCIGIQITPTFQSGDSVDVIAVDMVSRTGFRPMIAGKNVTGNIYSFVFEATGN